jgi:hypothetical protein
VAYQQRNVDKFYGGFLPISIDLTGDVVPEIIAFNPINDTTKLSFAIYVFICDNGKFKKGFVFQQYSAEKYQNLIVQDVNSDKIPELIIQAGNNYPEPSSRIWVYGYQNGSYRSLLSIPYLSNLNTLDYDRWLKPTYDIKFKEYIAAFGNYKFKIQSKSKDGAYELALTWKLEYSGGPSRTANYVYSWDGENFSQSRVEYSPPEYRFQAIQDGDKATQSGEYVQALNLYQSAVFDNKLKWYSPRRQTTFDPPWTTLTPIPDSFIDPTEYPRLAAYAYYRMVILHTFLGEMDAAQVKYATLQEKFPAGNPGHPYVEMATDFWNAYQSSGKMYNACAAAIAYADVHSEILTPLGSDYHGAQSHIYVPADVCPFR